MLVCLCAFISTIISLCKIQTPNANCIQSGFLLIFGRKILAFTACNLIHDSNDRNAYNFLVPYYGTRMSCTCKHPLKHSCERFNLLLVRLLTCLMHWKDCFHCWRPTHVHRRWCSTSVRSASLWLMNSFEATCYTGVCTSFLIHVCLTTRFHNCDACVGSSLWCTMLRNTRMTRVTCVYVLACDALCSGAHACHMWRVCVLACDTLYARKHFSSARTPEMCGLAAWQARIP